MFAFILSLWISSYIKDIYILSQLQKPVCSPSPQEKCMLGLRIIDFLTSQYSGYMERLEGRFFKNVYGKRESFCFGHMWA